MAGSMASVVILRSSDNQIFQVHSPIAKISQLVVMLLDEGEPGAVVEDGRTIVPVDVEAATLQLILQWMGHHHQQMDAGNDAAGGGGDSSWEQQFFAGIPKDTLLDFMDGVSKMGVVPLLDTAIVILGGAFQEAMSKSSPEFQKAAAELSKKLDQAFDSVENVDLSLFPQLNQEQHQQQQ